MTGGRSVRWRMVLLFFVTAGVMLAASTGAFYVLFQRVVRGHFDRRLTEIAGPIMVDLAEDPDEKDVDHLNIPDEYFEVLDTSFSVLQRSSNLPVNLPLNPAAGLQTVHLRDIGEVRVALIPFRAGDNDWIFAAGGSTREIQEALATLRVFALVLLPASLLLTAGLFGLYSNHLLSRIEAVVTQLRQFVSNASHELRTPLAVLQGETELLLARPRSAAEYEGAARVMESELKKLTRIVDGLFTLSMADAGQLRLASEPLYLEEVLEESCSLAAALAKHKHIRIERELQRDVLFQGDAAFLRHLFLIFIDNAIKYSPSGSRVKITLSAGDDVRVVFQDEGIGISRDDQPRIFERFFRAAPPQETQSGGLGLSIAQAIVGAYHGTIECESAPGRGSIFTVRLPFPAAA
jgi:signal transduction histidine kinase